MAPPAVTAPQRRRAQKRPRSCHLRTKRPAIHCAAMEEGAEAPSEDPAYSGLTGGGSAAMEEGAEAPSEWLRQHATNSAIPAAMEEGAEIDPRRNIYGQRSWK